MFLGVFYELLEQVNLIQRGGPGNLWPIGDSVRSTSDSLDFWLVPKEVREVCSTKALTYGRWCQNWVNCLVVLGKHLELSSGLPEGASSQPTGAFKGNQPINYPVGRPIGWESPIPFMFILFWREKVGGRLATAVGPTSLPTPSLPPQPLSQVKGTPTHTACLAVPFLWLPVSSQQAYNLIVLFPLYFEERCFKI